MRLSETGKLVPLLMRFFLDERGSSSDIRTVGVIAKFRRPVFMKRQACFNFGKIVLACAALFCLQDPAAGQGSNNTPTPTASQKTPIVAGPLFASPNHIVIPGVGLEPRMVFLTTGPAVSQVNWTIGQPVTADGRHVLPIDSIVINSNR
jgi:hypothetical protein